MTDLINIELRSGNPKQFNQAWDEMLLSLDNNMDEELLENYYGRQNKKVHR